MQRESFKEFVSCYSKIVLNTASRILGNTQNAQDVHQEVFLEIWRRWHTYNGWTNWDAYLYRTTMRASLSFIKKLRKERSLGPKSEAESAASDESLRTAELRQKLACCLAKLPKRQAEVFILARIEGLKTEKIADVLGCSPQTIRVHLHRALKRLSQDMKDYLID